MDVNNEEDLTKLKFDHMDLNDNLLRGVYSHGFEYPSSIQQKGIVPVSNGLDVIGQAQSGTGKTATFAIGSLNKIDPKLQELQ